jgi:hypothetical protein
MTHDAHTHHLRHELARLRGALEEISDLVDATGDPAMLLHRIGRIAREALAPDPAEDLDP